MNDAILERIAVALERIAAAHHPEDPVEAYLKEATAPRELLTLEQLKTVSAPFKSGGKIELCKESLQELHVTTIADLDTREKQERYLVICKGKVSLLSPEHQKTALDAITTLLKG